MDKFLMNWKKEMIKMKNKILHGDIIKMLRTLEDSSVDMIFIDPPYNLQLDKKLIRPNERKYEGVEDEWDRFESLEAYDDFTADYLSECYRVLKPNGTIWVIGTYHNIFRLGYIMQNLGYWILNDIIWVKKNPTPNFNGTRFNNAHETLIWASKNKGAKYTFNYQAMKRYNGGKQMRSDWLIPVCRGRERILIDGKKAHSTQKPEALLYRIILSSTNIGDTVLDPFFGTGTTGVVAKRLGRNWIGIEKYVNYVQLAYTRIKNVDAIADHSYLHTITRRNALKVKMSDLIDSSLLKVGDTLYSSDKIYEAVLKADSTLKLKDIDISGSIHKLSAYLLNKKNNNGWDYWYVYYNNIFMSLNTLRELYRLEIDSDYELSLENGDMDIYKNVVNQRKNLNTEQ